MAAEKGEKPQEKDIKIPVFSVLKKGSILKHIFLNSPEPGVGEDGNVPNQEEEPILIGRHPGCHIVLDHPSISRFHLEVRIEPAKLKLSVIDRSSVHGTWVSGTKIQPQVPVDLVDGDLLRLGASTRVYRFQWVPLSRASEMEKPMEPLLEEKEETTYQEEMPMPLNANSDDMLASNIHPVSDSANPSSLDEFSSLPLQMESQSPVTKEFDEEESLSYFVVAPVVESASFSSARNGENGKIDDFSAVGVLSEREKQSQLGSEKRAMSSSLLSRRSKSISLLRIPNGKAKERTGSMGFAKDMEEEIQKEDIEEQGEREGSLSKVLFADIDEKEIGEAFDAEEENSMPKISVDQKSKKSHKLQNSPSNVVIHLNAQEEVFNSDKENLTPEVSKESELKRLVSSNFVENKEQDTYASDEKHMTVGFSFDQKEEHTSFESSPSVAISALNLKEDMLHSDREMWTPESSRAQRRKEQFFVNHVDNEKEPSALDKDNDRPQLSFDQVLRKNLRDLLGSSSIDISFMNVEENQFQFDRVNWTPEVSGDLKLERPISKNNASNKRDEATFALDKENSTTEFYSDQKFKSNQDEQQPFIATSNAEAVFHSDKENQTPEVPRAQKIRKPIFENWTPEISGDLKVERPISKNNASNKRDEEETFALDKENSTTTEFYSDQKFKSNQDEQQPFIVTLDAEAVFHSDKENQTPEVPRAQKIKKPIFENCGTNAGVEDLFLSDKENQTPDVSRAHRSIKPISESLAKVEREIMRKRVERVPFQLLLDNNCVMNDQRMVEKCNNASVISANHHPVNNSERVEDTSNGTLNQQIGQILVKEEEKKKWSIVVDTSCFLNAESERSLRLLEGLKGTHLIIPMMVIRELDCMKRHESWFRKETKASSALKWIEECMVKSSWWIHVQSSSEMTPVASTPPASPYSLLAEGNDESGAVPSGLMGFSTCGSLMEIVSPTVEDHILNTALFFKRIKTGGQLVLLSNNITLKIKAMAEGLLCETPKEFRDSLVNPYSKRFLWKKSSPRGSTWSSSDQMARTENYYHQLPNIRKATDSPTGLKLILLRESHYAQTNSVK